MSAKIKVAGITIVGIGMGNVLANIPNWDDALHFFFFLPKIVQAKNTGDMTSYWVMSFFDWFILPALPWLLIIGILLGSGAKKVKIEAILALIFIGFAIGLLASYLAVGKI